MRRQPERAEQSEMIRLLRLLGAHVYTLGTTRRHGDWPGTMMSPGLPDLIAFLPARPASPSARRILMIECKRPGGRLTADQEAYAALCQAAGVAHVAGDLLALRDWLTRAHYLQPGQGLCGRRQ